MGAGGTEALSHRPPTPLPPPLPIGSAPHQGSVGPMRDHSLHHGSASTPEAQQNSRQGPLKTAAFSCHISKMGKQERSGNLLLSALPRKKKDKLQVPKAPFLPLLPSPLPLPSPSPSLPLPLTPPTPVACWEISKRKSFLEKEKRMMGAGVE